MPFVKAQWISQGKKQRDVPHIVKHAGKKEFHIPPNICVKILPSSGISMPEMLNFTLPNQTTTVNNLNPEHFFSHNPANLITETFIVHLWWLPMPTPLVVRKLVEIQHQAWLDGYQSIRYIHLHDTVMTHFPLWLISFWAAIADLRKNSYKLWIADQLIKC